MSNYCLFARNKVKNSFIKSADSPPITKMDKNWSVRIFSLPVSRV